MKKTILFALFVFLALSLLIMPVLAEEAGEADETEEVEETEESEETNGEEVISQLKAQITELKTQIETIKNRIQTLMRNRARVKDEDGSDVKDEVGELKEEAKEVRRELQLTKQLWRGKRGEEVELLQEILATDPEIYPEGFVTGYFGPLTYQAVKRFQKEAGIEQVGVVGPKTLGKINELLEEGAGESGQVPPGLLVAPGIRKKLGYTPTPPEGQELPPGISKKLEEESASPFSVSNVSVSEVDSDSALIAWMTDEEADSKVYYNTSSPVKPGEYKTEYSSGLVEEHEIELKELTPETEYFFFVESEDSEGNNATSTEKSFTTEATTE